MCSLQSLISDNIVDLLVEVICSIIVSCHSVLLLVWLVVLFKCCIRLKRSVKNSILDSLNQSTFLKALNAKVEYFKSLFLLAIVICEIISALLTLFASTQFLAFILTHFNNYQPMNNTGDHPFNLPNFVHIHSDNHSEVNNTSSNFTSTIHTVYNRYRSTIVHGCFGISLILAFTPVYTLMSYYAMIVKNSLNYNSSIKSVNLAREQKLLIFSSFVMCIFLLILLVRVELLIIFELVQICVGIIQLTLTFYYSKKLIRVLKWKIIDTKIAFGEDHYQYKLYMKSLKGFRVYIFIYGIVVISFCIFIILYSIRYIVLILYPDELHHIYGINSFADQSKIYINLLDLLNVWLLMVHRVPFISYVIVLFVMNLSTIPYLLSKLNFRCRFKILRFHSLKNLTEPLLN